MEKRVIFTVDVEGPVGENAVKKLIYGQIDNSRECGISMIMSLLDEFEIKGVFFVDVAEAWEYGEDSIADVLRYIKSRNHYVGVHVHPDRMKDKNRRFLWQYTKDEQYEILKECTDFYISVLGEKPSFFRAGRYGINESTLEILSDLGYEADFSFFYGKKSCKLETTLMCNKMTRFKDINLIPVSSYKSFKFVRYNKFDKIDASMRLYEYKKIINRMKKDDSVDVISMFAHSFSFIEWRKNPDSPRFLKNEYEKMRKMLEYLKISKSEFVFIDAKDLCGEIIDKEHKDVTVTDYSKGIDMFLLFIDRSFRVMKERFENNI